MKIRSVAVALLAGLMGAGCQTPSNPDPVFGEVPVGPWAQATFAGGCFWCVEEFFDTLDGVEHTISGYMGGQVENPTYRQVSAGGTGHIEVVLVLYDPARVSYEQLLAIFWRNIDPLNPAGQFCDIGPMYRSAIFHHTEEQRRLAQASKDALIAARRFERPIVTEIRPAERFWPAEEYHQDFYRKNPVQYTFYKTSCGRDRRLEEVWGRR